MNKKTRIHFSAGVKYNGMYYLTAIHLNALFMYDEKKDKLVFLTNFQKEKKREYLYLKAFLYKNEAWFIPHRAEHIAVVNLDTYFISYIPVNYRKCYNHEGIKYINFLYFNEKFLCLIPWAVDTMMIVDLQNKNTLLYNDIVDQRRNYQNAIFLNDKIYFFPWKAKDILVLDLETNERVKLSRTEDEESFGNVLYDKITGHLFHSPAKQNYLLIDCLDGKVYKKIRFSCWNDNKYKTFYATDGIDNIFFWGHERNVILKINKKDNSVKIYPITFQDACKNFFPICSSEIEALVYDGSTIVKYNTEEDKLIYLDINITFDVLIQAIKAQGMDFMKIGRGRILYENEDWSLNYFLTCTLNNIKINVNEPKKNTGNRIYNTI